MTTLSRRLSGPAIAALLYGAAAIGAIGATAVALAGSGAGAGAGLAPAHHAAFKAEAAAALPKMVVHKDARGPYAEGFKDGEDAAMTLADFEGRVVVLNVWATWCPPCRKEMPSIDRLAEAVSGEDVAVVALSTDRGGADPVRRFFGEIGVEHLGIYVDRRGKLPREAAVIGLPATLILDREGREIARLTGDAEWDTPEVIALVRKLAEMTDGTANRAAAPKAETRSFAQSFGEGRPDALLSRDAL
ncbi:MAG: TlpA disulfide reductase family protein [Pseudomonadota bacterium]